MNILLWILQVLLALHTAIGAVWKFSHGSAETMLSLGAIPPEVWLTMSGIELICSVFLILPAFNKRFAKLATIAAQVIAVEMLFFCALHIRSGDLNYSPLIYWLVVAAICAFIAYGRRAPKNAK